MRRKKRLKNEVAGDFNLTGSLDEIRCFARTDRLAQIYSGAIVRSAGVKFRVTITLYRNNTGRAHSIIIYASLSVNATKLYIRL